MPNSEAPLSLLEGREVSAVVFVRDYLQLQFDGPYLNAYVWPELHKGRQNWDVSRPGYKDALCNLIGRTIVAAVETPDERITLHVDDETSMEFSLRAEDRRCAEAVMVQDEGGGRWSIW